MEVYKKEDKPIANEVIKSINNHLWYLTEELSVLSLFDKDIPAATRNEMAKRLLSFTPPTVFLQANRNFPNISYKRLEPLIWSLTWLNVLDVAPGYYFIC